MLKKVLIIEDSTLQHKMYKTVFRKYANCEMVHALNGLEGMDKLALEKDIQLIILDINMPKMNGLSFLEAMQRGGYGDIPVIVISTEGEDEDIRRALEVGAKAYIKKPWKPGQISELIDTVLESSQ